jgi:nitroreductase
MTKISPIDTRNAEHAVAPLFLERWSPRAFDGTPVPEDKLMTILEAAHWAPSAFNAQPWRFVYALKGTPEFDRLLGLLVEFNQSWAKNAGALVFILSKTHSQPPGASGEKPNYSHSFDAGAAWGLLSLQAGMLGYHAHGMTGIHFDQIPEALGVPDGFRVEAGVAIGALGDTSDLPEALQSREVPSPRRPLAEVAFKGAFAGI